MVVVSTVVLVCTEVASSVEVAVLVTFAGSTMANSTEAEPYKASGAGVGMFGSLERIEEIWPADAGSPSFTGGRAVGSDVALRDP